MKGWRGQVPACSGRGEGGEGLEGPSWEGIGPQRCPPSPGHMAIGRLSFVSRLLGPFAFPLPAMPPEVHHLHPTLERKKEWISGKSKCPHSMSGGHSDVRV